MGKKVLCSVEALVVVRCRGWFEVFLVVLFPYELAEDISAASYERQVPIPFPLFY